MARDLVVMAAPQRHEVLALDAASGRRRWTFLAGGRVDSPPTLHHDKAFFGCDDGQVYAVRLDDGKLAWRFRAAPTGGISLDHGHISSTFPVPGSVLVLGGRVLAVAGHHTDLGGLHCWSLDAETGEPRFRRVLGSDGTPALSNNLTVAGRHRFRSWITSGNAIRVALER